MASWPPSRAVHIMGSAQRCHGRGLPGGWGLGAMFARPHHQLPRTAGRSTLARALTVTPHAFAAPVERTAILAERPPYRAGDQAGQRGGSASSNNRPHQNATRTRTAERPSQPRGTEQRDVKRTDDGCSGATRSGDTGSGGGSGSLPASTGPLKEACATHSRSWHRTASVTLGNGAERCGCSDAASTSDSTYSGGGGRVTGATAAPNRRRTRAADDTMPQLDEGHARRRVRLGKGGRPWTSLHARLQRGLKASGLLDDEPSVLVAVSGGQDSVCLLKALLDLRPVWGWRLGVVHCDHRWRTDSAENADFVRRLAVEQMGLAAADVHVAVAAPGEARCERSAREWRYGVFTRVAAAGGYGAVVTAHTATDRAETMLLNLLRGSGPEGLVALSRSRPLLHVSGRHITPQQLAACATAGPHPGSDPTADMDPLRTLSWAPTLSYNGSNGEVENVPAEGKGEVTQARATHVRLVRPLLEFTREETQSFVKVMGLPHFHDSTNDSNDHRRNMLRNEVFPLLRQRFNPRLDTALFRFVEVLQSEMDYMEHDTGRAYGFARTLYSSSSSSGSSNGAAGEDEALKLAALRGLPLAMQRRVVRLWLGAAVDRYCRGSNKYGGGGAADGSSSSSSGVTSEGSSCSTVGGSTSGGSAGERAGECRRGRGTEVGFGDVASCLALLHSPNRANSDQLCGGLVASVRGGLLLVRPAREVAASREAAQQQQQQEGQQRQKQQRRQRERWSQEAAQVRAQEEVVQKSPHAQQPWQQQQQEQEETGARKGPQAREGQQPNPAQEVQPRAQRGAPAQEGQKVERQALMRCTKTPWRAAVNDAHMGSRVEEMEPRDHGGTGAQLARLLQELVNSSESHALYVQDVELVEQMARLRHDAADLQQRLLERQRWEAQEAFLQCSQSREQQEQQRSAGPVSVAAPPRWQVVKVEAAAAASATAAAADRVMVAAAAVDLVDTAAVGETPAAVAAVAGTAVERELADLVKEQAGEVAWSEKRAATVPR